jgi:uncharacterized protein YecT (DUF1311 family)
MKIALVTLASLIVASSIACAADQGDPSTNCDGSTQDAVECLNAKAAQWDKRMTVAYQVLMKKAEASQRDQLRTAQRLWIQYRDANCMYYALGDGSISRIDAAECLRSMTATRAKEFETMTER